MLRTTPRRLLLRTLRYSTTTLKANPQSIPTLVRTYRRAIPPSDNESGSRASDSVTKQTPPPQNPEAPTDRMPHQMEEEIATGKDFGNQCTSTQKALPPRGVPVEEVFNKDLEALEQASEVMKANGLGESRGRNPERIPSEQTMPHVAEETIATERAVSGENAIGASSSTPGEENPAEAVPIEEAIRGSEKPAVMNESSIDDEGPPPTAPLMAPTEKLAKLSTGEEKIPSSETNKTPRKSILDLFGGGPRRAAPKKTPSKVSVEEAPVNPVLSNNLDGGNTDLSDWETSPAIQKWKTENQPVNPDDWATSRRGQWENEFLGQEESLSSKNPKLKQQLTEQERLQAQQEEAAKREVLLTYAREEFRTLQAPPSKHGTPVEFFEQRLRTHPVEPSPWDYFYPQDRLGKPLRTVEAEETETKDPYADLLPDAGAKKKKPAVYDPFARAQKQMKWPFQYNRDELVSKCVNHIMREGKKARAEKVMQNVFMILMEKFPRQHPVTVFAESIDRNAPVLKVVTIRDGMKVTHVPFPLFEKQRIRAGMMAMVRAAEEGDSATPFTVKLAAEVVKTMEGRGPGVPFRIAEHKRGMQNKLNVKLPARSRN